MPVIVNGSTGITTPASNTTGTQTVTTLSSPAATALTIKSAGTTAMTVDTGQNVGIGTTSPRARFQATGTTLSPVPTLGTPSGTMYITNSDITYGMLVGITTAGSAWMQVQRTDATATAYDLLLQPSGGNVGIGTSSPSTRLQTSTTSDGAQAIFVGAQSTNEQTLLFRNQYYTNNPTAGVAAIGWIDSGSSGGILTFKTGTNGGGVTNIPTERMRLDNSGNLQFNSGYGSVAVAYGCRAWVNFDGPTAAIRGSGNVTSVTRTSTGNYTVNLTSALPDTNYAGSLICNRESYAQSGGISPSTTSAFSIGISANASPYDNSIVQALIVR